MRERGREGAKGKSINSVQPSTARARKCTLLVKQLTQGTARGHFRHRTDRGEGGGLGLDGTRVAERKISKGQTFSPSPLKVRIESERASEPSPLKVGVGKGKALVPWTDRCAPG